MVAPVTVFLVGIDTARPQTATRPVHDALHYAEQIKGYSS
jgi:hypothetical protein